MPPTDRPYVICHMLPSVDGRIVLRDWKLDHATREYERTAATFQADAWIIGRISMEPYAGKARVPARKSGQPIAREDFIAAHGSSSYAIAIDPSGKLTRSEEHTSELQSRVDLVCRLLLEKKKRSSTKRCVGSTR